MKDTDSELLAEFIGWKVCQEEDCKNDPKHYRIGGYNWQVTNVSDMKFDHSLDYLLPVIEKMNIYGTWTLRPGYAYFESHMENFKCIKSVLDFEEDYGEAVPWVFIIACVCVEFVKEFNKTLPSPS